MSPTLKISSDLVPYIHLDIGFRRVVPEGLEVGGHADHAMFLEVAAEGILST
jgi:hypothetical protein